MRKTQRIIKLELDLHKEAVRQEQSVRLRANETKALNSTGKNGINSAFYMPDFDETTSPIIKLVKFRIFDASLLKYSENHYEPVEFEIDPVIILDEDSEIDNKLSLNATYQLFLNEILTFDSNEWKDKYRSINDEVRNDYRYYFYTEDEDLPRYYYPGKKRDDPHWDNFDENSPNVRYLFKDGVWTLRKSLTSKSLAANTGFNHTFIISNPFDPPEAWIYLEKITDVKDVNAPHKNGSDQAFLNKNTEIYVVPRPSVNSNSLSDPAFKMKPFPVLDQLNEPPHSTLPPIVQLVNVIRQGNKIWYKWIYEPPIFMS